MDKNILKIAVPAIISNIVVPLLGLIDLTIAGHLGAASFIGAIAVGAMMFNLTYWNFGFLRMGTTGLTAQAYGSGDKRLITETLHRATLLAILLGIIIVAIQHPLQWILLRTIKPEPETSLLAGQYFAICVWNAPAVLANMSISGWFIGMQNSAYPMAVSIVINVINIAVSLFCVYHAGMGFTGIAVGTVVAQWAGLLISALLVIKMKRKENLPRIRFDSRLTTGLGRFFSINSDIFLRSVCIMAVTLFFTSAGARTGSLTLAVNAIIMQLYMLYSYFMDGFAFAGEALAGRYTGAADTGNLKKAVRRLFRWGSAIMTIFSTAYGLSGEHIVALLTDNREVIEATSSYRFWAAAIPVAGMAAFIWDGIFIGLTATRQMLLSLLAATATFFIIYFGAVFITDPNNRLWTAFICYLAVRGLSLSVLYLSRKRT